MKRTKMARAKREHPAGADIGFSEGVRDHIRRRSGGNCEVRAPGCRKTASHFHHRQLRRSQNHEIENCLHVCVVCHTFIHDHPSAARELGWIVSQWQNPAHILWVPYADE